VSSHTCQTRSDVWCHKLLLLLPYACMLWPPPKTHANTILAQHAQQKQQLMHTLLHASTQCMPRQYKQSRPCPAVLQCMRCTPMHKACTAVLFCAGMPCKGQHTRAKSSMWACTPVSINKHHHTIAPAASLMSILAHHSQLLAADTSVHHRVGE
jgi:hypothetical protein